MDSRIDGSRLRLSIETLGEIGRGPDGVTRRSYTPADKAGRDFVTGLMKDAGLVVRIDAVGNIFGRRDGLDPRAPVIMLASHIDSVPGGGMFDGCLGVLGAIEAVRALNDAGVVTKHPLEVAAFADEEGAWGAGTFGSRVFSGEVDESELSLIGSDGLTLRQRIEAFGLLPHEFTKAVKPYPIKAYLELHIEQGGVLDKAKEDIGVVTGIVGITHGIVRISGTSNHAGTTPMSMRDDALVKAARFVLFANEEGTRGEEMVITIGRIRALPGAVNVIPGEVSASLELRSMSDDRVALALSRLHLYAKAVGGIEIECGLSKKAVWMDDTLVHTIEGVCKELGLSHRKMPSGAGHDAMCVANIAPAAMIFVPSRLGISHAKDEWTDWSQALTGVRVLLHSALRADSA